jgi:hypothetical protein
MKKWIVFAFIISCGVAAREARAAGYAVAGSSPIIVSSQPVVGSTAPINCPDVTIRIVGYTAAQFGGGIWGLSGAMGSGGFTLAPYGATDFVLPTIARNGYYTGDYTVHMQVDSKDNNVVGVDCGVITVKADPGNNYCPAPGYIAYAAIGMQDGNLDGPILCQFVAATF